MRTMPNPPRTKALAHEEAVAALQRWLWACVAAGWDPMNPANGRWSHDDNVEAMQYGWMIAQPPSSEHLDLFSLKRGVEPAQIMQEIISLAPVHPVCARAVVALAAQKMKYPDIKFAFDGHALR
jgi:hypothetical protein